MIELVVGPDVYYVLLEVDALCHLIQAGPHIVRHALSLSTWKLSLDELYEVLKLAGRQEITTIEHVKLQEVECASVAATVTAALMAGLCFRNGATTVLFRIERQVAYEVWFLFKLFCQLNIGLVQVLERFLFKPLLYFVREQVVFLVKDSYAHYDDAHVEGANITHFYKLLTKK